MPNKFKMFDVTDRCQVKKFRYDSTVDAKSPIGVPEERKRERDEEDEVVQNIKERKIDPFQSVGVKTEAQLQTHQQQWLQQQVENELKQQKEWDNFQHIIQLQQTQINEYQIIIEKLKNDKFQAENKLQQTILEQFKTISMNTETIKYLNCQRNQLQESEKLKKQETEHYKQLQQQQKSEFIDKYNQLYQENLNLKQELSKRDEINNEQSQVIDKLNKDLLKKEEIQDQLSIKIQQLMDNSNFNKNIQFESERLTSEKKEKENQEKIRIEREKRIESERLAAEKKEKERLERERVEKELEILNLISLSNTPEQIFQSHLNINIKTTYRSFSKYIHPDKCNSNKDPEIFQKLKEAYDILNGEILRSESTYFNFN